MIPGTFGFLFYYFVLLNSTPVSLACTNFDVLMRRGISTHTAWAQHRLGWLAVFDFGPV